MKIYMHVNYLEHQYPLETIVDRAAEAGYDGVELRGWDVTKQRTVSDYLPEACQLANSRNLELVIAQNLDATNLDPRRRDDSLQEMNTTIRIAADHGVRPMNVFAGHLLAPGAEFFQFCRNGSAAATEDHWFWAVESFRVAAELAAERNVDLCFETHGCFLHDLAEPTCRLVERIEQPNVKITFDYANIHCHPENPGLDRSLALAAPYVGYVHLKNLSVTVSDESSTVIGCSLREGEIDVPMLLEKILLTGYRGPIALENIFEGDKQQMLVEDLAYLRSFSSRRSSRHASPTDAE